MSDAEFANMYIERVMNEVLELTKVKMMHETRIAYLEKQMVELQKSNGRFEDIDNIFEADPI